MSCKSGSLCSSAAGVSTPLFLLITVLSLAEPSGTQYVSAGGYRLASLQEFLVIAPKKVRPEQIYELHVTLYRMHYKDLTVRAVLSREGEEYASGTTIFYDKGTKMIQLEVPITTRPGKHQLSVEGLVSGGTGEPVFKNVTEVIFDTKYVSLFIQTDTPVYYPPQTVQFRIVGVTPQLTPVYGSMTIYVKDGNGIIVRRWLQKQLNFGMYEAAFDLSYPVTPGKWSFMVEAFGHTYEKFFDVVMFWPSERAFFVNVTTPMYMFNTEWGVAGTLYGEHTYGNLACKGNATLSLRVRKKDGEFLDGEIKKTIAFLEGTVPFEFTMQDIKEVWGDVTGKDLFFKGWIYDWMFLETENGTSVTKVLEDGVSLKFLGRKLRTFKPNTPVTVYFAVQRSDGTPYAGFFNRQIYIQRVHEGVGSRSVPEEKRLIPDDAIVRYTFYPGEGDERIRVIAWHPETGSRVEIRMYRYFSHTGNYLALSTQTDMPKTDDYMILTVRTNFFVPEINYLIASKGNILLGSSLVMNARQKTFAVAVSRLMAPTAKIVAYCVVDGEIVMDSLNFFVKDIRLTKAYMRINLGKDFTQDTIELIVRGSAGGFVGVSGMDYEWYRRGVSSFFRKEDVIQELMTYDSPAEGPFVQTWYYDDERWEESMFFSAPTTGMDTLTTFEVSGLVALSDMNMTVKQEYTSCNRSLGFGLCPNGQCFELSKKCDGFVDCLDGYDEVTCPPREDEMWKPRPPEIKDLHLMPRYFDPTYWMWMLSYIKPIGQVEIPIDVPEFTDSSVISGFVLHPEHGMSLVETPVQHDTSRLFLMVAEAPSVIRRGEQIGIRLALMNNWDQEQEIILMLHGGENYRFVRVEEFGFVSSYKPRLISGDIQTMVELRAGEQRYMLMPVVPLIEEGTMTVSISAYGPIKSDTEVISIDIEYDGVDIAEFTPYLLDLVNQGSQLIPDFNINIPERFVDPGQRDILYIPGSNKAYMGIHGDMVMSSFPYPQLSLSHTVDGVSHHSADGYMFDYALNLLTLNYLQIINVLKPDDKERSLELMQTILMREFAYLQQDGGMKMFRRNSKPCVWFTAFVLKHLHATVTSQWSEQVYVDIKVLNRMALWLAKQQDESTGVWRETADVIYNQNYLPYVKDLNNVTQTWHIPVTALCTITLALTDRLTGDAKQRADEAKLRGANYLATKYSRITDPFQLAILAYALQVAKHSDKDVAYNRLKQFARKSEFVYWAAKPIAPNVVNIINTVPIMEPRDDFENTENAVMATSYALMLYLLHNELAQSVPIMKWIISQHNDFMFWSSTQDTLLALEALSEYAFRETNRDFYKLSIYLTGTAKQWGEYSVSLNKSNFADLQMFEMQRAYGEIRARAIGTGYAYLGMTTHKHLEKAYQIEAESPSFQTYELRIEEMRFYGRNASNLHMTFCAKWLRPDITEDSGMTYVTVVMPTGYMVTRDTIESMYVAGIPGLRRIWYCDMNLYIFFETIHTDEVCFSVEANRWLPVANVSITHMIEIKNYNEGGIFWVSSYETFTLFHLHICQVCGSFQCPYCQFYNHAPSNLTPPGGLLMVAAILFSLLWISLSSKLT